MTKRSYLRTNLTWLVLSVSLLVSAATYPVQGQTTPASTDSQASSDYAAYDPLKIDSSQPIEALTFEFSYRPQSRGFLRGGTTAEQRTVPVKVYLPSAGRAPVVMFSHGLGGSREGFKHGGEHWARRGYVAVFLQHPGSDESVWRDKALGQRMTALRDAASAQNLTLRVEDVHAVIDLLEKIEQGDPSIPAAANKLRTRMDLKLIGMSGHSFGAITTQMVSGQSPALSTNKPTDARIKAAVVLSPSSPRLGQAERAFSNVQIPWMLMTGTKDDSPIGDQSPESRLQVFPALPAGSKYQVVFEGGTHAFLGERNNVPSIQGENSSHARATVALATAFWDAYLKQDANARRWLDADGPKQILAPKDVWQKK